MVTAIYVWWNTRVHVKDVVDKDVKDSTQTAASENNEGSVNHVQGKNTEVTKLTERGSCINYFFLNSIAVKNICTYKLYLNV
jgi:outer membrane protein W